MGFKRRQEEMAKNENRQYVGLKCSRQWKIIWEIVDTNPLQVQHNKNL